MDQARHRIESVHGLFDDLLLLSTTTREEEENEEATVKALLQRPVHACFMLSSSSLSSEQDHAAALPSTVARELGFAAHHAIHHMAMIKIIATHGQVGKLDPVKDLPADFGRAPSTVQYDSNSSSHKI